MSMLIYSAFFSIAGIGKLNEDSWDCQTLDNGSCVAVVADGVGGNYGGSIASALATSTAVQTLQNEPTKPLKQVIAVTSNAIKNRGDEDLISSQMATTLSLGVVENNGTVKIAHVGDSRIYHLRGKGILQKTKDQTEVAALVEAGILSREQAKTYPRRTVLRSALTPKGVFDIFETEFVLVNGDRIVLLSDGVYRLVTKSQMRDLSLKSKDVEELSVALKRAIDGENDDDATVVILEFSNLSEIHTLNG